MKVIVYTGDSGTINILTPVYPSDPISAEEEAALLERLQRTDVPRLADGSMRPSFIKVKDSAEINRVGTLFASWRLSETGEPRWDAAIARELKKEQFRELRKPLLEKLDVAFMRSLEDGDTAQVAEIGAKKKALRDVTLIDMSQYDTPEKLNAFIPEVLKEN